MLVVSEQLFWSHRHGTMQIYVLGIEEILNFLEGLGCQKISEIYRFLSARKLPAV